MAFNEAQSTTQEKDSLTTSEDTGVYCTSYNICTTYVYTLSPPPPSSEALCVLLGGPFLCIPVTYICIYSIAWTWHKQPAVYHCKAV